MDNEDLINNLFSIGVKLDLSSKFRNMISELEEVKDENSEKILTIVSKVDELSGDKYTKEMVKEAKRAVTYFEDYIGCLKRISDLSKKSAIGD